jgi:DNA invertase Pin-like site-specific DNA recombinase
VSLKGAYVVGVAPTQKRYAWETVPVRPTSPAPAASHPAAGAVLYLRVSTDEQTVENQRAPLEAEAVRRGLPVIETVEEVVSGSKAARPGLSRLDALAREHGPGLTVLVWSLSRLGRSMAGNVRTVLELDALGARVVSLQEPWLDTPGPIRPLLIAIFSWVAEQERAQLIERTKAGMARAKSQGRHLGRPAARIDPTRASELHQQGVSVRSAAKALGVSPQALRRFYARASTQLPGSDSGTVG